MPTTKTSKAKPSAAMDWQEELSVELDRAEQRRRAAFGLMLMAASGGELSPDEISFLRIAGFDDATRRREIGRIGRALTVYKVAGTAAQRQAAADRLAALEESLSPVIDSARAEIERLQAELAKAEADLASARSEVERRNQAAQQLTEPDLLPNFARAELDDIHKCQDNSDPAKSKRDAEARLAMIRGVTQMTDAEQIRYHAQGQRSQGRDLFTQQQSGPMIRQTVCPAKWNQYLAELAAEVPALESQLAQANKFLESFEREAEAQRRFWLLPEVEEAVFDLEVI